MTYLVSDIHGEYDLFCKLLDKIEYSDEDELYVLGDFLDKGNGSARLARLLCELPNVKAILGNHEHYFLSVYEGLLKELPPNGDAEMVLQKLQGFFPNDGKYLSWAVLDFIENLPLYFETETFICVHAGLQLSETGEILPLREQEPNFFLFDRRFADKTTLPKGGKTVFFGHTPCHYDNGDGKIIKTPRDGARSNSADYRDYVKIRLDNGVSYTKALGCLRLEDMREFYVSEKENF
ncbi:MAG: serine/threonine protein phosphatase [Clostridia bacterium]|nr:serine/threonine protein phosphatase [Clostridia bacterium]